MVGIIVVTSICRSISATRARIRADASSHPCDVREREGWGGGGDVRGKGRGGTWGKCHHRGGGVTSEGMKGV